jgi:hypothetical protein
MLLKMIYIYDKLAFLKMPAFPVRKIPRGWLMIFLMVGPWRM